MSAYKASVVIIVLIILGKLSGFLKDILLTYYHGVSAITDAFFLANSISSVLYMAVFSSIPVMVIPFCTNKNKAMGGEYKESVTRMFTMYMLLSFLFSLVVWWFSPQLVAIFSGKLDLMTQGYAIDYVSIMAVSFVFSAAVSYFNSLQLSERNIVPSYVTPILNNFIFCLGLMIFFKKENFYIVLILGVVSWLILMLGNFKSVKGVFDFKYLKASRPIDYFVVFQMALPAILSLYIEQINAVMSILFSAKIGAGAVTIMNYGNKLNGVLLSVFVVILTTIVFPRIAEKVSKNDVVGLVGFLLKYIKVFIFLGVPVVLLMALFSKELVSIVFERGAFDREAVNDVSTVFSVVVFGLLLTLIRDLINRVFFAYKKTSVVMYLSLVAVLVNFILSYVMYEKYELVGLAYAGVASLIINVFSLLYLLERIMKISLFRPVVRIVAVFIIGGLGAILFFSISERLGAHMIVQYIVAILAYSSLLYFVYIVSSKKNKSISVF